MKSDSSTTVSGASTTLNRFRAGCRFAFLLLALALGIIGLARAADDSTLRRNAKGAEVLLQGNPQIKAARLFVQHCAECHRYNGGDGAGHPVTKEQKASDLKGFGSRDWLTQFLSSTSISSPRFFGATQFKDGKMARYVKRSLATLSDEERADLRSIVAYLSSRADLPTQRILDRQDAKLIAEGRQVLLEEKFRCLECHLFDGDVGNAEGPDLIGYGSRAWLIDFLNDPGHIRFYGKTNDGMPAFGDKKILDAASIRLIADWLRGEF